MTQRLKYALAALAACLVAAAPGAAADDAAPEQPVRVKVFGENEDGSRYYRIPGVAVTNDGTIVAVADKRGDNNGDLPNVISVVSKRSTDGGLTWSEAVTIAQGTSSSHTFGDPAIAYDPDTNTLLCVFSGDKGFWYGTYYSPCGFYASRSTDGGLTWSEPVNFCRHIYRSSWRGAFCASGSMLRLKHGPHAGRIMFVANVNTNAANDTRYVKEYVCYTDDLGKTWGVANPKCPPACDRGNESKLVEFEDGTLLMSIRYPGARMFSTSTDGGATWSDAVATDLVAQDCNGAVLLYPSPDGRSRLLHSYVGNANNRVDVSVSLSYDHGRTWAYTKRMVDGYSAYSDLCVLPDGTVGLFVEDGTEHSNGSGGGYELVFVRFTIPYLTDGDDNLSEPSVEAAAQPAAYYDLHGRSLLAEPDSGLYIEVCGSEATKRMR